MRASKLWLLVLLVFAPGLYAQDFRRGDADVDGHFVAVVDSHFMLRALFSPGSPLPECLDAADSNDNGSFDIADVVNNLTAGFLGGTILAPGTETCGPDPTSDGFNCTNYPNCVPSPLPSTDPGYVWRASDASGGPGDQVTLDVTFDCSGPVAGWQFAMCHDGGAVQFVSATEVGDLDALQPDFSAVEETATGWCAAVLVNFLTNETLPAGVGYEMYQADYSLLSAGASTVAFCDGSGPVAVVAPDATWIMPELDDALVTSSGSVVPVNDDCANQLAIGNGMTNFVLANATTDGPDLAGFCDFLSGGDDIVHHDVWYCYTAAQTGAVSFSTVGSGLDTRLAIYSDCTCPADPASVIICDDDALGVTPGESEVELMLAAGDTVLIQVGVATDSTPLGSGVLTIEVDPMLPPSNDDCANSILIGAGRTNFSLDNATTDGPDLAGLCDPGPSGDDIVHQDVWFRYVATCEGDVTIDTAGSSLDTRLAVYASTSCPVDPTTVVACADDALGFPPGESSVTFPVTTGQEFLIQVGTFSETSGTGNGVLNLECDGVVLDFVFLRGDANTDAKIDLADSIFMLSFLFVTGAPAPTCADAADANDDESLNIADPIFLLNWLFNVGSPQPSAPGPFDCGVDPFGTGLDCAFFPNC